MYKNFSKKVLNHNNKTGELDIIFTNLWKIYISYTFGDNVFCGLNQREKESCVRTGNLP